MLIFSDAHMLKCSNAHLKTSRMLWDRHQPPVKLQGEKVIGCSFWSFHPNRSCHNRHDHHHHQLPVEVCLGGGGHEVVAAPWLELHLLRWGGEAPETGVMKIYLLLRRGRSSWNRSCENIFATEEGVIRRYNRINIRSMLTTLLVYAKVH